MSSSVLRWPDPARVVREARAWAASEAKHRDELRRLGYFGSYARGDAGVGSDLDLVAVLRECDRPFERRAIEWDLAALPVPAGILVYTEDEWRALQRRGGRFARMLQEETVWIYEASGP